MNSDTQIVLALVFGFLATLWTCNFAVVQDNKNERLKDQATIVETCVQHPVSRTIIVK